jgi:tetratricopeptide (TPR) repeat protein
MNDRPTTEDIRATVERIIASDVFSRSPQLGAFLRFVAEAVLQGKSDRIKGYTIGVEVLRRDPSFDPQADPIVRVEATRLRRALERYYSGAGADDAIIVDLPRGSYVPTFRRREISPPLLRTAARWPFRVERRSLAFAAILVLAALETLVLLWAGVSPALVRPAVVSSRHGNGMPVLAVEMTETHGLPGPLVPSALAEKIADAMSRFDTVNVVLHPEPSRRADYRLIGAVDQRFDQPATVRFRLVDGDGGKIVWSRTFEGVGTRDERAEEEIVTALASDLLQSYGVIRSLDRAKHLASPAGDPRYRCVLEAAESFRSQQRAQYAGARACLETLTDHDPGFAVGFSFLAILNTREHAIGAGARPDGSQPLDRALRAARRAIELNPASARAHVALFVVLFARRELPEAFAAAEKALTLNPYDMLTVAEYGGRLVMTGEIERGTAMLRRAAEYGSIQPSWHHFYRFLGAYLGGDMREAAYQAGQITADNYPNGRLAKALAAAALGDHERARAELDRLYALQPAWRVDPAAELGKFLFKGEFVERVLRDLAAIRASGHSEEGSRAAVTAAGDWDPTR